LATGDLVAHHCRVWRCGGAVLVDHASALKRRRGASSYIAISIKLCRQLSWSSHPGINASCGGAYGLERATDPLHRARIDTKPPGYLAHAVGTPWRLKSGTGFALPTPALSAAARVGHYSFCAFKLLTFFVSQCHDDRIFIDAKELGRVVVGITED
jgi:hypothetical protein